MKFAAGLVIALLGFTQAQPVEERKHVMLTGGFTAPKGSALNIWRDGRYPGVVHFKGDVEIKAKGFILRAGEADFHEATGEIEARGTVQVKPYPAVEHGSK